MSPFLPLLELYGDAEVDGHLTEQVRVESWLEVERALADVQAERGLIPADVAAAASFPERSVSSTAAAARRGFDTLEVSL